MKPDVSHSPSRAVCKRKQATLRRVVWPRQIVILQDRMSWYSQLSDITNSTRAGCIARKRCVEATGSLFIVIGQLFARPDTAVRVVALFPCP